MPQAITNGTSAPSTGTTLKLPIKQPATILVSAGHFSAHFIPRKR